MKSFLVIGWVVACIAGGAAGQNNSELPTAAKQAVTRMDASVVQAKKKAIADLTAILNSEKRSGRLESAVAVDAKIKDLAAEIDVLENRPSGKGTDFLPGRWRMGNGVIFTFDKGKVFAAAGGNFKWAGTWRTDNNKLIVDSAAFVDTYDLPAQKEVRDGKAMWTLKGKNSKGETVYLDKLE